MRKILGFSIALATLLDLAPDWLDLPRKNPADGESNDEELVKE